MEDDDIENSSGGSLLPLALAILAIVLGGAGLYFGMTANQRLSPLTESMQAGTSSAAQLEKDIAKLQTQLTEISLQNTKLEESLNRMRIYSNQSEQAVKQLASGVKDNRTEMVKLAERINELVAGGARPAPVAAGNSNSERPPVAGGGGSDGPDSGTTTAAPGTYTIVSGDTFAKIASKMGVSLQALLDANPNADPRRLAIGQVINIPGN